VLLDHAPIEREIQTPDGLWFRRRILPYRAHNNSVEGVVITFTDITKRKLASAALEEAKHEAEQATMAKSRFLAAASHDLRQPLQTLALLQGLLAKTVSGEREKKLLARLDETLGAMSGMLNALLDINQIEAGVVHPEITDFRIDLLLDRLHDEFGYHAQAKGLAFHVVPCSLSVVSDPRLLEQMIRNLLSNALKYTRQGKVLLGCRRHGETLSIEIWDTGIGIPAAELESIFEEYHQIDNVARERRLGLGLGLSIVQRLASLLGHRVRVRSRHGKGSMFAIEVKCATNGPKPGLAEARPIPADADPAGGHPSGKILVVEDDPEVRDLLGLFLTGEGHRPVMAPDGPTALDMIAHRALKPDLVIADYNLPNGLNGLQLARQLRRKVGSALPIVILSGDISTGTLRDVAQQNCQLLNKPVKLTELSQTIERLLPPLPAAAGAPGTTANVRASTVFIVDDDAHVRATIAALIEADGGTPIGFPNCEAFLAAYRPGHGDCLLVDAYLPGMSGIDLLLNLRHAGHLLPAIMITGNSDVAMAVQAMKAGATDFIEKPVGAAELMASIHHALELSHDSGKVDAWRTAAAAHLAALTPRQRQIMDLVLAGHPSKNIAADLDISQRTVENHRASIMKKTGSASLPALARLALAAAWSGDGEPSAA
jgi:two-component system CheB/CheR fusion protein